MRNNASQGAVLVLGSDTRSFLSVVRSLGRYGLTVDASWVSPNSIALGSRYLQEVHQLPTPWECGQDWVRPLNGLLESRQYDLVIPCNDPTLIPLQQSRHDLCDSERIYLLDDKAFEITQSKIASTELAESLGVSVPRHATLTDTAQGLQFAANIGFPVVLKPTESYQSSKLARKQLVVTTADEASLTANLQRMLKSGSVQAQQFFDGTGTGVEFLAKEGQVLFAFQHLRLHEPMRGGGSSYRIGIDLHPGMLDATHKIVNSLNYSGVGMVEFRWDQGADRWIFVEINGRFWGSLPLAVASGADFPKFLYQSRVEGVNDFPAKYRSGICCRNWERDKNWFMEELSHRGKLASAKTFFTEATLATGRLLVGRERSDTLTCDDMKPGLVENKRIVESVTEGAIRKLRQRWTNTKFHRSRHRRRMNRQLQSAQSILFVCKGNICRSPFAEHYAKQRINSDISIQSSGYIPRAGRSSPETATAVASEFGVQLEGHRSSVIDECMIQEADAILVFDDENREELVRRFPLARRRIYLLGVFSSAESYIADPYGQDPARFHRIYASIQEAIDVLVSTNQHTLK